MAEPAVRAVRLIDEAIVHPGTHPSIGTNIQGPSPVEMPEWASGRLGRFHLYFADHKGAFIRLAYADTVTGPWHIHEPGVMPLADSRFLADTPSLDETTFQRIDAAYRAALGDAMVLDLRSDLITPHVASPDVHVDHDRGEIVMYFHGLVGVGDQQTRVATSTDGLHFSAGAELLGPSYFRVFRHGGWWYALAMPGLFLRSRDGRSGFQSGPQLFGPAMRHSAVRISGDVLDVFWSRVGDAPEQILWSRVDCSGDWMGWNETEPVVVLAPERPWEGGDLPLGPSIRGAVADPVRQLRDPGVLEADGRTYLFYATAGESGIGVAELASA